MKLRTGFVSNSSSASFVVKKENLCDDHIFKLLEFEGDWWEITQTDEEISGYTVMDNGALEEYLEQNGINQTRVKIESNN